MTTSPQASFGASSSAWALIGGLVAGLLVGLWMLYQIPNPNNGKMHFGGSAFKLSQFGLDSLNSPKQIYVGFVAVLVNLVVTVLLTVILRAAKAPELDDVTEPGDFLADRSTESPPPAAATSSAGVAGPEL